MSLLKTILKHYLIMIGIFFIGRLGLMIIYFDRVYSNGTAWEWSFLFGLRMDTITASMLLILPVLVLTLAPKILTKAATIILRLYFLIVLLVLIYLENASFPFIAEFDVRPNEIFINYLQYPKEVLGNIWAVYKLELLIALVLMVIFGRLYWRFSQQEFIPVFEQTYKSRLLLLVPLILILALGIRSSFGHRPANISDAIYSSNRLLNEITKNTPHAIGYAYYSQFKHDASSKKYGKIDLAEALQIVSKRLDIAPTNDAIPFLRKELTNFPQSRPKNLVLFIQESLGAQFVGSLGGETGITPQLDRLAEEGLLFTNLYSNGTRSIRGLAGLISGFLPVAGEGVIKRNKSQSDFFTIASLLKPYGYHTSFIYGGEKRFDNMASWFYGNGFVEIIDEPMFKNPVFHGIWGVSDEDLVVRANQEFIQLYEQQRPFVSVMFSTTNHTPFEFPDGRIELHDKDNKNTVKNAIKFADFEIGKFIDEARKEAYYKDTIFVIAADHNVRVYGDDLVPVNMFHIPALILGENVPVHKVKKISSQPDVIATALDLLGLDFEYPILGRSVFSSNKDTAFMNFHDNYTLRVGEQIAVLQPGGIRNTFRYENQRLVPIEHNYELEKEVLAFVTVLSYLYENKLHSLPEKPSN